MWSIFNLFKSKKPVKKQLTEEQLEIIKLEIQTINKKCEAIADSKSKDSRDRHEKENSTCPKCKATQTIDKFKRTKGAISGRFSGTSGLFGGSSYGSIYGELDTLEVNQCRICGNEWKKTKPFYWSMREIRTDHLNVLRRLLKDYKEARECKFDKSNLEEIYKSREEKVEAFLKQIEDSYCKKETIQIWEGFHIETIKELMKSEEEYAQIKWEENYDEGTLLSLGLCKFN